MRGLGLPPDVDSHLPAQGAAHHLPLLLVTQIQGQHVSQLRQSSLLDKIDLSRAADDIVHMKLELACE